MMRQRRWLAAFACMAAFAGADAARAQDSGWMQRVPDTGATAPQQSRPRARIETGTTGATAPKGAAPGSRGLATKSFKGAATAKRVEGPVLPAPTGPKRMPTGLGPVLPERVQVPADAEDGADIAFAQGEYLTALEIAEKQAAAGRASAYGVIGRIYAEGLGVSRDEARAAEAYRKGAEAGDAESAFALGVMLAEGRGVPKDRTAAATYFEAAARTGHALANYNLGVLFLIGDGKPENPIRAAQHIEYAASQGVAAAQYDIAALYQTGTGVAADAYLAATWMHRAAEQGLAEAELDYAVMILRGFGLNADVPKAIDYLKSAAAKGLAAAQNRLAWCYAEGVRVGKNPLEAARWRLIAKAGGLDDPALDTYVGKLSAADRARAERAANQWLERAELQLGG